MPFPKYGYSLPELVMGLYEEALEYRGISADADLTLWQHKAMGALVDFLKEVEKSDNPEYKIAIPSTNLQMAFRHLLTFK